MGVDRERAGEVDRVVAAEAVLFGEIAGDAGKGIVDSDESKFGLQGFEPGAGLVKASVVEAGAAVGGGERGARLDVDKL